MGLQQCNPSCPAPTGHLCAKVLGVWEKVNNPNFNYVEFDRIKSKATPGLVNNILTINKIQKILGSFCAEDL